MNHKYKTIIFKFIDVLPEKVGYFLYHALQNLFSKQTLESRLKATEQSYNTICKILKENGVTLNNKCITEMGSGWAPIVPYLLKFDAEALVVNTYDINEHYMQSDILKLNKRFTENGKILNQTFTTKYQLPIGINYFPKTNVCEADLENTDLVISRFVLEHVPLDMMNEIHQVFSNRLRSGSYVLHLISPSDHRSYSDSSLSLVDFLQYSFDEWNKIQTKFDYHNRLRLPQYLELFKAKFEIVHVEYDYCKTDTTQYQKFKNLKIHQDFKNFSDEELTAGSINILLKVI